MKRVLSAVVMALGLSIAAPGSVDAQIGYFGQNKVQYRTFKLATTTGRFAATSAACPSTDRARSSIGCSDRG
jgi:hypothetical protein